MGRCRALVAGVALLATACGGGSASVEAGDGPFAALPEPEPPRAATADEVATVVGGMSELGLELFGELAGAGGNVAISPWSVSEGMALSALGAEGTTAAEMEEVLNIDLEPDAHHTALRTVHDELLGRANDGLALSAANRVFAQRGMSLTDSYLADLSRFYEAPLSETDFGQPEDARAAINDWVAEQTEDRIPELFPSGTIDAQTRLALVNALHLDAEWHFPFNADNTEDQPFWLEEGRSVSVPTMHYNEYLPSGSGEGWQVVKIPYAGEALSMLVIVPTDLASFRSSFDAAELDQIRSSLQDGGIHLALPRFELAYHTSLVEPLQSLGMRSAFSSAADFSRITGRPGLFIDAIEHSTFVSVDEDGTEAAAATGTGMALSHGPTVTVNRPFVFLIQDDATGAVLMVGQVTDPQPPAG